MKQPNFVAVETYQSTSFPVQVEKWRQQDAFAVYSLAEILSNGVTANGPCLPLLCPKSTVHKHFQRWNKAGIFLTLLAKYGEKVESLLSGKPLTAACCSTPQLNASDTLRQAEAKMAAKFVCLWTVGHYWGGDANGINVRAWQLPDSPLKNSQKMGSWLLDTDVCHLCLDKGYDYPLQRRSLCKWI